MSTDLKMLAWTAALTLVLWLPYILSRMMTEGAAATLSYMADSKPLSPWAERARKAHYNAVENLAPFAALVLVANMTATANGTTATAAVVYFWARVAHYIGHISGLPYVRTLTFTIGWIACLVIFFAIVT
jgi:uncharacterized MAPEG superfamily protein